MYDCCYAYRFNRYAASRFMDKITGLLLLTFGFFGSHSIASSWVGRRATHDKAQASSLYLFFTMQDRALEGLRLAYAGARTAGKV